LFIITKIVVIFQKYITLLFIDINLYYNYSNTKHILTIVILGVCFSSFLFVLFSVFKINEDYWICKSGKWVKHGKPSYPQPIVSCAGKAKLPRTKDECLKQGGVWKKLGPDPFETCNFKAKDRGNICYDSSECEGSCQANLTREELREGMKGRSWTRNGQCSVWIVELGCQGIVREGKASVMCID